MSSPPESTGPSISRTDYIPPLEDFLSLKAEDYPPYCGTLGAALIPRGEILFPHGPPRVLKTWAFASLCLAMASGRPWLDMFPVERCRVLYLQGDGGRLKWQERIQKLMRGMGLSAADLKDWFRTDMRQGRVLAFKDHIEGLIEACGDWHPQVAVFDPLARFIAGELDENSNRDMGILVSRLERFQVAWRDCELTLQHHETKNTTQEGGGRMRGAAALWAAGSTCRVRRLSRTKSELEFTLKDYEAPPPFVLEVEIGTEIATVKYLGTAEADERREKTAIILATLQDTSEPLTFKDIEETTGLHHATVRRIIDSALEEGLLEEAASVKRGRSEARAFRTAEILSSQDEGR